MTDIGWENTSGFPGRLSGEADSLGPTLEVCTRALSAA